MFVLPLPLIKLFTVTLTISFGHITKAQISKPPEPVCRITAEWEDISQFTPNPICLLLPKEDDPFHLFPSNFPSIFPQSIKFIRSSPSPASRQARRRKFSHLKFVHIKEAPSITQVIFATGLSPCLFNETEDWIGFINAGWDRRLEIYSPYKLNMKTGRKQNIMPGSELLCNKIPFQKKFRNYQGKYGWDWFLPALILPEEREQFLSVSGKENKPHQFIYKPSTGSNSRGVVVLGKNVTLTKEMENGEAIIQKYLTEVFLFQGAKIEPRFFVLVTSVRPLRIYLWDDGIAKVMENYEKKMAKYGENNNISIQNERGTVIKPLMLTLQKMRTFDIDKFLEDVKDIIIKTLMMGEQDINEKGKGFPKGTSFQTWSLDFMWDNEMKPYLIEINRYLTFMRSGYRHFDSEIIMDFLNVVGFPYGNVEAEKKLLKNSSSKNCTRQLENILGIEHLKKEDIQDLMKSEDELSRIKWTRFRRIFPREDTFRYLEFLEGDFSPYILQQRWETTFYSRRKEGIRLLRCVTAEFF